MTAKVLQRVAPRFRRKGTHTRTQPTPNRSACTEVFASLSLLLVLPGILFEIPVYFRERVEIVVGRLLRIKHLRQEVIDRRNLETLNVSPQSRDKLGESSIDVGPCRRGHVVLILIAH